MRMVSIVWIELYITYVVGNVYVMHCNIGNWFMYKHGLCISLVGSLFACLNEFIRC